jgi:hypothetical protein
VVCNGFVHNSESVTQVVERLLGDDAWTRANPGMAVCLRMVSDVK